VTFTTPNRFASICALKCDGRFGSTRIDHVERRRAEPLAVLVRWLLDVFGMAGRGKHRVTTLQDGGHECSAEATR